MTDDEILKLWIPYRDIIAFARAIAAEEREACASMVLGWREFDWPEGFDRRTAELLAEDRAAAIRARSESGSQSGMCQCGSNLPPYAPCVCFDSKSQRNET